MSQKRKKRGPGRWEARAAELSFFGGLLCGLFGSVLTAASWVVGAGHPVIRSLGTALMLITIPLLIFAGYCLDWMERKIKTHSKRIPINRDKECGDLK